MAVGAGVHKFKSLVFGLSMKVEIRLGALNTVIVLC